MMLLSVQYMRAIAALLVLITHAATKGAQYSTDPMSWFKIGSIGIDLFFIISGFIMCHVTYDRPINFGSFFKARLSRIIPLYWVLTTLALVVYLIYPDKVNSSGGNTSILNSYTLFPTEDKYLINNGWTLSYEFFFYFIFGTGLYLSNQYRRLAPSVILISLAVIGLLVKPGLHLFKFMTDTILLDFILGIVAFELLKKTGHRALLSLVLLPLALLLAVHTNFNATGNRLTHYGIPAFLFFMGLLNLEPLFEKYRATLVSRLFKKVGDSSYSLYLFHPFVLVIASIILKKLGLTEYGYLFVAVLTLSAIVAGHLCYVLLESNLAKITRPSTAKTVKGVTAVQTS